MEKMEKEHKGFFAKLRDGLKKTGGGMLSAIFGSSERINSQFYDELEEALIVADVGMTCADEILDKLRDAVDESGTHDRQEAKTLLRGIIADMMRADKPFIGKDGKAVLLIVGVNGVGKTTSCGKLAAYYSGEGRSITMAAADTFRAAAAEQLTVWAERADVPLIKHGEGADPAAVVFDAIASMKAKNRDMLICDTAGRLHNKKNLMNELDKIRRVINRELPDARIESLLVLDATTGQNAILQAKVFAESAGLTGIILTKLDGTAKGGCAIAIKGELGLPVRFVGVGEGIADMRPFDADEFASALL